MSAIFDYISGNKEGREAELEASLEHASNHLGLVLEERDALDKSHADLARRLADAGREIATLTELTTDRAYRDGRLIMDTKQELVDEIGKLREAVNLAIEWINPESDPMPFTHREIVAKLRGAIEQKERSAS